MLESVARAGREAVAPATAELLSALRAQDVHVWVEGDRLRLRAPKGVLTAELQEELARRKGEIVAYVQGAKAAAAAPALTRVPRDGGLPLSFAQERMWFLQRLAPESVVSNLQANIPLPGRVDAPALDLALTELVRRHEVLRTTFVETDGRPVQVIAEPRPVAVPASDLTHLAGPARAREAERLATAEVRQPFDLERGPLFRMRLLCLDDGDQQLLVTQHHIVTDGWSIALLVEEILTLYHAFATGRVSPLPEPPFQYVDFACWQRDWLRGEVLERRLAYWRERLGGTLPVLDLPTDRPRPAIQTFNGATLTFQLSKGLSEGVHAFSRAEGVTPFMTLLGAFAVLLARHSGQEDVVLGTANGSRPFVETERLLGLFVNTVVLRTDLSGDPSFRETLRRVRKVALEAFAHGDLPFEKLVEELRPERDLSRSAVFQVLFVMQNTPLEALTRDASPRAVMGERGTATHDLSLYVTEGERGFQGSLEYNTDLFDHDTGRCLARRYQRLLAAILENPESRISSLPLLDEGEARRVLVEWNETARDLPAAGVHELVAAQAARTPEALAVSAGELSLTYAGLDRRADQLARRLRERGVGPGKLVGVYLERSLDMVVAVLGVLRAGAAYVPLDAVYPRERLAFMLEQARATAVVTQQSLAGGLPSSAAALLTIDEASLGMGDARRLESGAGPDDLAYVIFTSGSTGRPKGVEVTHRGFSNVLHVMREITGIAAGDVLLAVTTLAFDIAGLELFLPLMAGGRVVLASRETAADPVALGELIDRSHATMMQATPATWRMLIESGWRGDPGLTVLCGGEALPVDLARALRQRCGSVWNLYGPTETTIYSTAHLLGAVHGAVPIGRPIANTIVRVLDRHVRPVPVGVAGELYIGGVGVARGYLGRPDLTAERFVPDPFAEQGARLYRTGDVARWRSDGVIEFLGRTDHQVKVRGFRIERGEVEAALLGMEAVKSAVVLPREKGPGDVQLVAYVVSAVGHEPTVTELRSALKDRLPFYMVPSSFVFLDDLPLTPNGKVDHKVLARIDARENEGPAAHVEPRTATERLVAEVWKEVLGVSEVSVHDNFFDLGGHSLLSMRVLVRIEKAIGQRLNPRELIFQTLEQFAAMCEKRAGRPVGSKA